MTYLGKLYPTPYILCTLFMLLLISSSCIQEAYTLPPTGKDTSVELSVRSGAAFTADENRLFEEETAIHSIRVLTFNRYNQAGPADFERNQYAVKKKTPDDGGFEVLPNGTYKVKMVVKEHVSKDFYVLVNEPSSLKEALDKINTVDDLNAMQYTLADYFTGSLSNAAISFQGATPTASIPFATLPMFGTALSKSVIANEAGFIEESVSIAVSRALARVDLKLKKESRTAAVSVVNNRTAFEYTTYPMGNLTDQQQLTTTSKLSSLTKIFNAGGDVDITHENFTHVLSFYTPARTCGPDNELIHITIGKMLYDRKEITFDPIILKKTDVSTITEIKRNTVYEVNGTIKNNTIDVSVKLLPWIESELDTDIGGGLSVLTAPSTVFMNYVYNASYTKTVSYSGSHEVAVVVGGVTVTYVDENTPLATSGGPLPTWLTAATWQQINATSGTFTFTSTAIESATTSFDVTLKCGTATRNMSVKYNHTAR